MANNIHASTHMEQPGSSKKSREVQKVFDDQKDVIRKLNKENNWYSRSELEMVLPPNPTDISLDTINGEIMLNIIFPDYLGISSEERTFVNLRQLVGKLYGRCGEKIPHWMEFDFVDFRRTGCSPVFEWGVVNYKANPNMTVNDYLKITDKSNFISHQLLAAIITLRYHTNMLLNEGNPHFVMAGCKIISDINREYDSPCISKRVEGLGIDITPYLGSNTKGEIYFPEYKRL